MGFGKLLAIAVLFRSGVLGARIKHSNGSSAEVRKEDSCKDTDCEYKLGRSCQCNDECYLHNSCCQDKEQHCKIEFPEMPTEIPPPQYKVLRGLKGKLDKWPGINHVAAYIIVEPANPGEQPKVILQNPLALRRNAQTHEPQPGFQYQALGGYKGAQNLPYKIAALRSEIYDEGNVVISNENLIRASPLYIRPNTGGALGPVLLQAFYVRQGDWLDNIGSNEFGSRGNFAAEIVSALPMVEDGQGIEDRVPWRPVDKMSFQWLKEGGVIEGVQDEEKAAALWEKGVVQTFDDEYCQRQHNCLSSSAGFKTIQAISQQPEVKASLEYVAKSAWWPVKKEKQLEMLCC